MVNCGATIDVFDFLRPTLGAAPPRLYVIDSHRYAYLHSYLCTTVFICMCMR